MRFRFIDPLIREAGWDSDRVLLERPLGPGKIAPAARSGIRIESTIIRPDYVFEYAPNYPIAILEAKSKFKSPGEGMQQSINYAKKIRTVKFAYSSNGKGIEEYDFITKQQRSITKIPGPEELWTRLNGALGLNEIQKKELLYPLNKDTNTPEGKIMEPRYYQENAINITMNSILHNIQKILLVLATEIF